MPCIVGQVLATAREVTTDPWLHRKVLSEAMLHLAKCDTDRSPAEVISELLRLIHKPLGSSDPFKEAKNDQLQAARVQAQALEPRLDAAEDKLRAALLVATAANAYDAYILGCGIKPEAYDDVLEAGWAIDDYEDLLSDLDSASSVLYIGDSLGEAVFDKIVMAELKQRGKEVTFVAKRRPLLNDACLADADALGLGEVATVVDNGSDDMGLSIPLAANEIREHFQTADVVIAKGAANLETLENESKPIYFALRVKCPVVAKHLGTTLGAAVLLKT